MTTRIGINGFGRIGRTVGGSQIAVLSERDPAAIDWAELGVDIVEWGYTCRLADLAVLVGSQL
jgi:glyceraldehyde-3-phosphate dehydrogenase/erythrose-4-phosphate dehydrogenase